MKFHGIRELFSVRVIIYKYWGFLIAALALLTIGWSSWMLYNHPYIGATWSFTNGAVITVDPSGPSASHLRVGDTIQFIDGLSVYEARGLPQKNVGDSISFTIWRQNSLIKIDIKLIAPSLYERAKRLSIIPIAISFWLLGTIVLAYVQQDKTVYSFFLFCQAFSVILSLGAISSYAPTIAYWFFGLLLWWIGPLAFHTHQNLSFSKIDGGWKYLTISAYALALLFCIIDICRLQLRIPGAFITIEYLWVGILMLASASVLIYRSIYGSSIEYKRRTRIIGLSAFIAFLPSVLLSLIPDALFGAFLIPYEITFLVLPILPLGYGYSIVFYRLVKVGPKINENAANALAIFVVVTLYLFAFKFISYFALLNVKFTSTIYLATLFALSLCAHSFIKILRKWIYETFYGGWLDDKDLMKLVIQDLERVGDNYNGIAITLCQILTKAMQLNYANLLLSDGQELVTASSYTTNIEQECSIEPQLFLDWCKELKEQTGHEIGPGKELTDFLHAKPFDGKFLIGRKPQTWVLFGGNSNWQGLLVLGYRHGGGELESKDVDLLEVALRQASVAFEKARLLTILHQHTDQILELHRQVILAREEERKRLARDLHDMIIQTIIGVNYQLSGIKSQVNRETVEEFKQVQNSLRSILVELRRICANLRPAVLDSIGLVPALEARISEIQSQVPFEIQFNCNGIREQVIPDLLSVCIYRFVQETLLNIIKHSEASIAIVDLRIDLKDNISISVLDDGKGFVVPDHLQDLIAQRHYGLLGLQEQIEAVGGLMKIESTPGMGCQIWASIPLFVEKAFDLP